MRRELNSKRLVSEFEEMRNRELGRKGETVMRTMAANSGYNSKFQKSSSKLTNQRFLEDLRQDWEQDPYLREMEELFQLEKTITQGSKLSHNVSKNSNTKISRTNVGRNTSPVKSSQTFFKRHVGTSNDGFRFPRVSCKNWVCLNADTQEIIAGHKIFSEKEVASVTKVMTCLITLDFVEKHNIDIDKTHYLVSRKAATLGGTTARLQRDDYVCIRDLLYGLMLPSGNDAAQTLAENIITHKYILEKHKNRDPADISYDDEAPPDKNLEKEFYLLMNRKARELGLHNTNYASSHGLGNQFNYSCCYDQAILGAEAMEHPLLQEIVRTPVYTGLIERNDRDCELVWKNTNKLLDRSGYLGIKTGITTAAGGCLATYFKHKDKNFVTVILGARDQLARFTDTEVVHNWVVNNYQKIMEMPVRDRYTD